MHAEIEAFENDGVVPADKSKEYLQCEQWRKVHGWEIFRTEWSIYNEEARCLWRPLKIHAMLGKKPAYVDMKSSA